MVLDIWSVRVWIHWVSCIALGLVVEGTRGRGRSRKTWDTVCIGMT